MKKLIEIENDLIKLEEKIMAKIDKYGWNNSRVPSTGRNANQ